MMRSHLVLAVSFVAMANSANAAPAADHAWMLDGRAFAIRSPCAARVTIVPDGAAGTVSIVAQADHPEEIARLAFEPDGDGTILHPRPAGAACWRPAGDGPWTPTLTLAVRVPAGARLEIDDAGQSVYRIGAVGGPLGVALAGHATLADDAAAATSLDLSGATRITLGRVAGSLSVDASGDSAVTVDAIDAPHLTLDLTGTYRVATGRGAITSLAIDARGAGEVAIGGTVAAAEVSLSGAAHVRIPGLAGPIEREVSGAATIATGP